MTQEQAVEYYKNHYPDDMPLVKISESINTLDFDGVDILRTMLCDFWWIYKLW